jgi:hypothetical protein
LAVRRAEETHSRPLQHYAPRMSRGRHSKPHAKGGGLATLIALAVAGGAVALASAEPTSRVMRYSVVGLAVLSSFQLLMMARTQRTSSRAMARTEDRLRTLEQRNREEGDELHRRVLAGVAREGDLRRSVETLVDEISRLRASLEVLVPVAVPVAEAVAPQPVAAAPEPVAEPVAQPVAQPPLLVDIPLVDLPQTVSDDVQLLAAPVAPAEYAPAEYAAAAAFVVAAPAAPVEDTPWAASIAPASPVPAAGDLWRAPSRPEYVPAPPRVETPVTSWVVREIQLGDEPGAALTMRILDLTTPQPATADSTANLEDEPMGSWTRFARPA